MAKVKLTLLFVFFGFLALLLQLTFFHVLPLGPVVPDLTLILCVYLGLYRPTVGSVLGSFLLGYSVDVFSSPVLGLNTFAMSVVFLVVYLSSRRIWIHNELWSAVLVFAAGWVKGVALILALGVFASGVDGWHSAFRYIFLEALCAAILAPAVFFFLRRSQSHLEPARTAV
ncbi:MAG TPA: rod shape-determining protein MreD [Candidatus Acidoferrales bacterium]|nr:rod shape-determining protein MreD [Candidatus Acidoferrales bacterium]